MQRTPTAPGTLVFVPEEKGPNSAEGNGEASTPSPAPKTKAYTCATCGCEFQHPYGGAGRPPKHCPSHRKTRGTDPHRAETVQRSKARAKEKAAGAKSTGSVEHVVADLAAALSVFPDPERAADYLGIPFSGEELDLLVQRAKTEHGSTIEGDPAALGRRLTMAIHLMANSAVRQRALISPRDLPHVAQAFAKIHSTLGLGTSSRFSEVNVNIDLGTGTGSGSGVGVGPGSGSGSGVGPGSGSGSGSGVGQ